MSALRCSSSAALVAAYLLSHAARSGCRRDDSQPSTQRSAYLQSSRMAATILRSATAKDAFLCERAVQHVCRWCHVT
eukprot:314920-Chlamydomonas_euryale.AAC.1